MFKIDPDNKKLHNVRKEQYNHVAAQTLWVSQQSRPDVQLEIGFHWTHVKISGKQD